MSINRNKYQPYIFGNGRAVLVENKIINEAIDYGKEILIICNARSGGYATVVGAEKMVDDPDFPESWAMYGYDIKDKEFNAVDLDRFYRVIISSGEQIWMESGEQANTYQSNTFIDYSSSVEDIRNRTGKTMDYFHLRSTVDPRATVTGLNYKYTEDHKPDYTDWEERIWALINIGILPKDAVKYIPISETSK